MADVSSEAKYRTRPRRSPPLASTLGETPQRVPRNASFLLTARRPPLPAPPAARCCRGPGTAQLQRGPMATQPRHRLASPGQWWRGMGTALILRRPIAARAGIGPPTAPGRVAGRGSRGRRSPAPPRSPLTRCLVSPSSCSKPRGRAGTAKLREGTRVATATVAAAAWVATPARVRSSFTPAAGALRRARTWRLRRTRSATRAATSCASVWSCRL